MEFQTSELNLDFQVFGQKQGSWMVQIKIKMKEK